MSSLYQGSVLVFITGLHYDFYEIKYDLKNLDMVCILLCIWIWFGSMTFLPETGLAVSLNGRQCFILLQALSKFNLWEE